MSRFLSIEPDPVDQPDAPDLVERRTWCALRIRVAGRVVTRVWDRERQQERELLYVPAFPIAEWMIRNWWVLLNEPCPAPEVPRHLALLPWIKCHCLRSAASGLLLPALYFFNDGRGVRIDWYADAPGTQPHMPGEFVDSNHAALDRTHVEDALAEFVSVVLSQVADVPDERVQAAVATWQAIRAADAEEARFCIAAGRLGIDPYDPEQLPASVADFLANTVDDPDQPLLRDFTEAVDGEAAAESWSWIQRTSQNFDLGAARLPAPSSAPLGLSPFATGYQRANLIRAQAGLTPAQPIPELGALVERLTGEPFEVADENQLQGSRLRAVVGWAGSGSIVLAGRRSPRRDTQRFLEARGLYHALFTCGSSQRLVTAAYTWDQQASRAFAAELLAPQAALAARAPARADLRTVERLADEFSASVRVIENQLENAGVALVEE